MIYQTLEISLHWNYVSNTMMADMELDNLLVQQLIKLHQLAFVSMVNVSDMDLEVRG